MKKSSFIAKMLSIIFIMTALFSGCTDEDSAKSTYSSVIISEKSLVDAFEAKGKLFISDYLGINPKFNCSEYNVGDSLFYGKFEQDNNKDNGAEPIEWIVLEADNTHLIVMSKYALYPDSYHWEDTKYKYTTWETSTMREWLNSKFYENSFSQEEKQYIALNKIVNDDNLTYGIEGGNDTEDYVYFLSHNETLKYLPEKEQRRVKPTEYAIAKGAHTDNNGYGYWWLRTPGIFRCNAEYVFESGDIYEYGSDVGHDNVCARPVIRIEHNAVK